jgi:hypothetical protein
LDYNIVFFKKNANFSPAIGENCDHNIGPRWGEIITYRAIVSFGEFLENHRSCIDFWATFFHGKSSVNYDLSNILIHFITNLSGHPDQSKLNEVPFVANLFSILM